ncbi:MAG: LAGLIDADG family homing endonuclease [Candidatus Nanohaloarchaea archaeon]|nr:LAGLIDADG family homing endonuclease [Candidatus Nanohaloarchaea archaeon]
MSQSYSEKVDGFVEFFREAMKEELSREMSKGSRKIVIDFNRLSKHNSQLADSVLEEPEDGVAAAEDALEKMSFVDKELKPHFSNLPETDFVKIRDLRSHHLGRLIGIKGIVKRASEVRPELVSAVFECDNCGDTYEKEQDSSKVKSPYKCDCGSRSFELVDKKMVDVQIITIEEDPEQIEGAEQPRKIGAYLRDDLVDPEFQTRVVPGNKVRLTGILREQVQKKDKKRYDLYIESSYIEPIQREFEEIDIDQEDKEEIEEFADQDDVFERIVDSMAPSIHGHRQIKKAIALQLFSGVRKERADDTSTRGDMHILLIGEPGTGKCVSPDTSVTLKDGSEKRIEEIVESRLDRPNVVDDGFWQETDFEVPCMGRGGKLEFNKVSKVWKREAPSHMYRIKTSGGKTLEVTPSHPLFVASQANIRGVDAEELSEGEFIAVPRRLKSEGRNAIDIDFRESKARNAVRLDDPDALSDTLASFLGVLVAEGNVQKREDNSGTVYVTNKDEEILQKVEQCIRNLGLNFAVKEYEGSGGAKRIICSSSEFVTFLENLEPSLLENSRDRRVPSQIMRSESDIKRAFLSAFIDAEGTVSRKQREIVVGSTSRRLLEQVQSLLLHFGISSQLREREGSHRLRISGEDAERYISEVGFLTVRKTNICKEFEGRLNTNTDIVPGIRDYLKDTREMLRLSQFECGIPRGAFQHYERRDRNPSRDSLERVVEAFDKRIGELRDMKQQLANPDWRTIKEVRKALDVSQEKLAQQLVISQTGVGYCERMKPDSKTERTIESARTLEESINRCLKAEHRVERLRSLCESDVAWEKIESIERHSPDYDWVYDLEVEDTHNFITNNVFSHNSMLLQFTGNLAPKGRYVVGKSASAAGITATVMKDEITDEWTLEAGALVLANKGIATVDEIDKMDSGDRSALHEALEQQSITVSKANIQATLQCRTSILAAGNPKFGRFDPYQPVAEQIDISDTLLSRFDLIFPVKDIPEKSKDEKLSDHILSMHTDPDEHKGSVNKDLLKKYIAYAKKNSHPKLSEDAQRKLKEFYVNTRAQGSSEEGQSQVPITARQLEALIRLSEASAKTRLSEKVGAKDAQRAIDLLTYSLKKIGVVDESGDFDIDKLETGMSSESRNKMQVVMSGVKALEDAEGAVLFEDLLAYLEDEGIGEEEAEEVIKKLKREGELYEPKQGHIGTI